MLKDFKAFILRGNVVDLAVGVVIGAAFGTVVESLVADVITPIISIPGETNFADLTLGIGGAEIAYGRFVNAVVAFVLVAAAVFFVVVKPLNALTARRKTGGDDDVAPTRECPWCLSEIPAAARVCSSCTREVAGAA